MTNTTLDRFQVLSVNELTFPHNCAICGSFTDNNGKKYIDFGLFIEFYGNVYICTECFFGAVQSSEWFVDRIDESEEKIKALQAVVVTLIAENRGLRDAVDNLRSSIISSTNTDTNHDNVVSNQNTEGRTDRRSEESEISSSDSAGVNPVGETTQLRSVEQINVEGSSFVRENDSSDSDSPVIGLDIFNI